MRWSSQADHSSADPHAQNQLVNNALNGQVYEALVARGRQLELVPALATAWKQVSPTVWRFGLRKGVRWHDGAELTADDVVFSFQRAQGDTSTFRVYARGAGTPRRIDAHTVEFTTPQPNPAMLEMVSLIAIVSRAWCEKHQVQRAQDFSRKEETHAARNANGTGPFMLVSREPDVRSVFRRNPAWWGTPEGRFEGNVSEFVYTTIKSDATRMAALASGEVDLVLDPPIQDIERLRGDPRMRVYQAPENLVFFLGMDQAREELLRSDVKGRNPFRDRRVRQALYQALDVEALNRVVMRGFAVATGLVLPNPPAAGIPKDLDRRLPHDPAAAKKLLAEAGYPGGFSVELDCQNVREKLCTAIAGMFSKVGVRTRVNALSNPAYFARGQARESSLYLLGWGGTNTDAIFTLQPLLHGRSERGDGDYNWGGYRDDRLDALIDAAKVEVDAAKRQGLVNEAVKLHRDEIYHIPIHRRMAPWASRATVEAVHRPHSWLDVHWVRLR